MKGEALYKGAEKALIIAQEQILNNWRINKFEAAGISYVMNSGVAAPKASPYKSF